jgi:Fe-Mn family superoxide dismutase
MDAEADLHASMIDDPDGRYGMQLSRRSLLQCGAIACSGFLFMPMPGCQSTRRPAPTTPLSASPTGTAPEDPMPTEYTLPPLPYAYDALQPHLDAQTLRLHHDRHHQGYVNGANHARAQLAKLRASGDFTGVDYWEKKLAFHTSGHLLHSLFWSNMAPVGKGGQPSPELAAAVQTAFGGTEPMKAQLSAAAKTVEGSGWGILGWNRFSQSLTILQCENHQKQAVWSTIPLLVVDVWEHAYYLQYQNRRGDFIKAWWNVVNWQDVSARLLQARAVAAG